MHQLHCPQSVPTLAEDSALRRNMPQRNDESEDALKRRRISFSPAGAVWGKMGQAWIPDSRNFRSCPRSTQALTPSDYVAAGAPLSRVFARAAGGVAHVAIFKIERCNCHGDLAKTASGDAQWRLDLNPPPWIAP